MVKIVIDHNQELNEVGSSKEDNIDKMECHLTMLMRSNIKPTI